MQKSKLGLPVTVVAAVTYLVALFGGYIPALLVAGYILLREDENWLRRAAVKALAILLLCSTANVVINLLPDVLNVFRSMTLMFGSYFSTELLDNMVSLLVNTISLGKTVILVLLAVLALFNKTIDIKPLSKIADKE